MKLWTCLALLVFAWAAIYLPALGEVELKGEEIRRILPAQEMLRSGDWIVPRIAGEVYGNKPPLMNWVIAGMFSLTGVASEFTARLPSALSMLALALAGFFFFRREKGNEGALILGLFLLTAISLMEKGRSAEIEPLFVALFGIACFAWIRLWSDDRSPWLYWTLPYVLIGLGCLLKGPVHLLFWGLFLFFTLRRAGSLKSLLHPAHAVGLILMAAIFVPWTWLYMTSAGPGADTVGTWTEQLAVRANPKEIEWDRWLTNPLRIPASILPWVIPFFYGLYFLRKGQVRPEPALRRGSVTHGALACLGVSFVLICLMPGGLPRYLLPIYPLVALVALDLFSRLRGELREKYEALDRRLRPSLIGALAIAPVGVALYGGTKGYPASWLPIVAGLVILGGMVGLILGPWKMRSTFLHTALLLAAGWPSLIHSLIPFQADEDLFRDAAAEIRTLVPEEGSRIVFYADEEFRTILTKHLRLLFYTTGPVDGIGESGTIATDAALVVGRPEAESAMREKLGNRQIAGTETITIRGIPLLALRVRSSE